MPGYRVELQTRLQRRITLGRYATAEHARRDCFLLRISHPRAEVIRAIGPTGQLLALHRRDTNADAARA